MSENQNAEESVSSDEENFEDAKENSNEDVVNEMLEKHFKISDDKKIIEGNGNEEIKPDKDDDDDKFADCRDDLVDDESQRDFEKHLTEEEKLENKEKAEQLKNEGNEYFKNEEFEKAADLYTQALRTCPVEYANERAILYGNRAAAKMKLNSTNAALDDCSKAIEFNPEYQKALIRRAKLYEETEKLDESLEDYKKILELDPSNTDAQQAIIRLPPLIQERNEKLKEEMLGKLKDLGNIILKPFGLSTNNFQMQQDPSTGSYSIQFKQN